MLEKPELPDRELLAALQREYGLRAARLDFLPLGADVNTAVYRLVTEDQAVYFIKLRKGDFDESTVALPRLLKTGGIRAVIAPLDTHDRRQWAVLKPYTLVVYPFIQGQNAYQSALTEAQWQVFGAALKSIHATQVPAALAGRIPRETYSGEWREQVKTFLARAGRTVFVDPAARQMAAILLENRRPIEDLLRRAETLALRLRSRTLPMVLNHSDIHPGNLLLSADGELYIVDWDNPIFAPKERDLMLIGGCPAWNSPRDEALFYAGYGPTELEGAALAYFRCERVIQDIAAYGQQLLLSDEGGEDREQGLRYFASNFLPGHEIELAMHTEAG